MLPFDPKKGFWIDWFILYVYQLCWEIFNWSILAGLPRNRYLPYMPKHLIIIIDKIENNKNETKACLFRALSCTSIPTEQVQKAYVFPLFIRFETKWSPQSGLLERAVCRLHDVIRSFVISGHITAGVRRVQAWRALCGTCWDRETVLPDTLPTMSREMRRHRIRKK